jgi:hypothetical protein
VETAAGAGAGERGHGCMAAGRVLAYASTGGLRAIVAAAAAVGSLSGFVSTGGL